MPTSPQRSKRALLRTTPRAAGLNPIVCTSTPAHRRAIAPRTTSASVDFTRSGRRLRRSRLRFRLLSWSPVAEAAPPISMTWSITPPGSLHRALRTTVTHRPNTTSTGTPTATATDRDLLVGSWTAMHRAPPHRATSMATGAAATRPASTLPTPPRRHSARTPGRCTATAGRTTI